MTVPRASVANRDSPVESTPPERQVLLAAAPYPGVVGREPVDLVDVHDPQTNPEVAHTRAALDPATGLVIGILVSAGLWLIISLTIWAF